MVSLLLVLKNSGILFCSTRRLKLVVPGLLAAPPVAAPPVATVSFPVASHVVVHGDVASIVVVVVILLMNHNIITSSMSSHFAFLMFSLCGMICQNCCRASCFFLKRLFSYLHFCGFVFRYRFVIAGLWRLSIIFLRHFVRRCCFGSWVCWASVVAASVVECAECRSRFLLFLKT